MLPTVYGFQMRLATPVRPRLIVIPTWARIVEDQDTPNEESEQKVIESYF